MFSLYSKSCEYAVRVLTFAVNKQLPLIRIDEVCEQLQVPEYYTRKSFQKLASCGILKSLHGPGGGYQLARTPAETSILAITLAIDGEDFFDNCAMGLAQCGDDNPCQLHKALRNVKKTCMEELEKMTLADLAGSPE